MEVDFAAAEAQLRRAREAHQGGDEQAFLAARYLVMIALGLTQPQPPIRTPGRSSC